MYLAHFKLTAKPFQLNTDPRFLWLGQKHREALATLTYGVKENKGLLLLTGDIGTGKTTLISGLVTLIEKDVVVAKLPDPGLTRNEFFFLVSRNFGIKDRVRDKETFTDAFALFLESICASGRKALLIIDEAQIMSQGILEEVRLFSNMECRNTKLLNILLVGQNEFNQLLLKPENRALRERITINYNLTSLTETETAAYIAHRLRVAGAARKIFTAEAVSAIQAFTNGSPRQINILCDLALVYGFQKHQKTVDTQAIEACEGKIRIPDVRGAPLPDEIRPRPSIPPPSPVDSLGTSDVQAPGTFRPVQWVRKAAQQSLPSGRMGFYSLLALLILLPGGYAIYAGWSRGLISEKIPFLNRILSSPAPALHRAPNRPETPSQAVVSESLAPIKYQTKTPPPPAPAGLPEPIRVPDPQQGPAKISRVKRPAVSAGTPARKRSDPLRPDMQAQSRAENGKGQDKIDRGGDLKTDRPAIDPPRKFEDNRRQATEQSREQAPAAAKSITKATHTGQGAEKPAAFSDAPPRQNSVAAAATDKPAAEILPPTPPKPATETPDPADIINWLIQEKRKAKSPSSP